MSFVERAPASIQLFWVRLRLPALLVTRSLDDLLADFSVRTSAASSFRSLERALDQAEALTERLPLIPRTCLYRCIARYALFRRYGFPVEFVMGISPNGPDEDGHAWLEFEGEPYREPRAQEFVVAFRFPSRAR